MNFLLRSTQPSVPEPPPPVVEPTKGALESVASWPGALSMAGDYHDDSRLFPGSARMKTRMPIEGHADVAPADGSILVPFRE